MLPRLTATSAASSRWLSSTGTFSPPGRGCFAGEHCISAKATSWPFASPVPTSRNWNTLNVLFAQPPLHHALSMHQEDEAALQVTCTSTEESAVTAARCPWRMVELPPNPPLTSCRSRTLRRGIWAAASTGLLFWLISFLQALDFGSSPLDFGLVMLAGVRTSGTACSSHNLYQSCEHQVAPLVQLIAVRHQQTGWRASEGLSATR